MPITAETSNLDERRVLLWIGRAITWLVYAYLVVVQVILVIGFLLLLFGANPSAGFVSWAYRNLDRVMAPFRGIFTPIELGTTSADVPAVLDTSIIFAMIVYGIVVLAIGALVGWLTRQLDLVDNALAERTRRGSTRPGSTPPAARKSSRRRSSVPAWPSRPASSRRRRSRRGPRSDAPTSTLR